MPCPRRSICSAFVLTGLLALSSPAQQADDHAREPVAGGEEQTLRRKAALGDVDRVNQSGESPATSDQPLKFFPLPPGQVARRVIVRTDPNKAEAAGESERLVYSNTLGRFAARFPVGALVADDISLNAPAGCNLRRYSFQASGRTDPDGVGGAYTIEFALYDNCPNAGGEVIPGTNGSVSFTAAQVEVNALANIVFVVPGRIDVPIPPTVWLGVTVDRQNSGVILGAPALVGFSGDAFDFPLANCAGNLGGFPQQPHASFNAQIYLDSDCPEAFLGYRNINPGPGGTNEGRNVRFADDVELQVDSCDLIGYEIGARGPAVWSLDIRADEGRLPGAVIAGTEGFFFSPDDHAQIARVSVDPPVHLTSPRVWVTVKPNTRTGKWILVGKDATVGRTDVTYAVQDSSTGEWQLRFPDFADDHAGFYVTLLCAGQPPVGACCDMYLTDENGDSVCREVPEMNCAFPVRGSVLQPGWVEGATCDPDPFPHPCGQSACCRPDDTCENLTLNACDAVDPVELIRPWQRGSYCGDAGQACPFNACIQNQGECTRATSNAGCKNSDCCTDVCEADRWCCLVEWDAVCLRAAQDVCLFGPPNDRCISPSRFDLAPEAGATGSVVVSNKKASFSIGKPVFSCHEPVPEAPGVGNVWFSFEATETSAHVHTCNTDPPADNTIVAVYRVGDLSTPYTACDTLTEIGCSDDAKGCGSGASSDVCVDGLTPGEMYFVRVASADYDDQGVIQIDIESPCLDVVEVGAGESAQVWLPSGTRQPYAGDAPTRDDLARLALIDANQDSTGDLNSDEPTPLPGHWEVPDDPPAPRPEIPPAGAVSCRGPVVRNGFVSIQVNVDASGNNIIGDAANEPSIAVDPTDPNKIVIGWRQFDSVESNFRQAGWAYSHDAGRSWTFPGVLEPGVFRSDPVLDAGPDGTFYYYSLTRDEPNCFVCDLFRSTDGGVSWDKGVPAHGGDKAWLVVDRTGGTGHGNIYAYWSGATGCCRGNFTRSTDGGAAFMEPTGVAAFWGTIAIGADGAVYVSSGSGTVAKSISAKDPTQIPVFETVQTVDLGGSQTSYRGPNPGGLLGQMWVATEPSGGSNPDNVYLLGSVEPEDGQDPLDVMFARSLDGGQSWSRPIRVNDDPIGSGAWQWFGTMSVAPTGRIDVVWNDTRATGVARFSELYYSYSIDEGRTWSTNIPVSPVFDSWLGFPNQNKIGDYYHAVSDAIGVNVAYAATFNGEQDVYFLRIDPFLDCDGNRVYDPDQIADGSSEDCNANLVPDECERDLDKDGLIDGCDPDIDGDGVPNDRDACRFTAGGGRVDNQGRPLNDTNQNCGVDLDDYWRFRNCMLDGRSGAPAPAEACRRAFDMDQDGTITLRDFASFQNAFHLSGS